MDFGFILTVHKITVCADISASKLEKDGPLWTMAGHSERLLLHVQQEGATLTGPQFLST